MPLHIFGFLMVPVLTVLVLAVGREFRLRYVGRFRRSQVRFFMKMSLAFGLIGATLVVLSESFKLALASSTVIVLAYWFASYLFPSPEANS